MVYSATGTTQEQKRTSLIFLRICLKRIESASAFFFSRSCPFDAAAYFCFNPCSALPERSEKAGQPNEEKSGGVLGHAQARRKNCQAILGHDGQRRMLFHQWRPKLPRDSPLSGCYRSVALAARFPVFLGVCIVFVVMEPSQTPAQTQRYLPPMIYGPAGAAVRMRVLNCIFVLSPPLRGLQPLCRPCVPLIRLISF